MIAAAFVLGIVIGAVTLALYTELKNNPYERENDDWWNDV